MTMEQTQVNLEQLSKEIEEYHKTQDLIKRLQTSQDDAKKRIAEMFGLMGNPDHYDTGTGLRARFQLRYKESINVEEARYLLDQPTFDKLLHITDYQAFTIVKLKEKEG